MSVLTLYPPAKLNVSLRIVKKRADGFHEIDTLIIKLPGLCDKLTFQPADEFVFACSDTTLPGGEDNLVVRGARAFEEASGRQANFRVSLEKNIPHGAGLGGGSSDAASMLLGLNQLSNGILSKEKLGDLAAEIGSDVPCFLSEGACRCTGRGEVIVPSPPLPPVSLLLLKPGFSVATADAYRGWQHSTKVNGVSCGAQTSPLGSLFNDLEQPVFEKHRFLAEMKYWLLSRAEVSNAMLTGSGSTMFVILKDPSSAQTVIKAARRHLDPHLWTWSGTNS